MEKPHMIESAQKVMKDFENNQKQVGRVIGEDKQIYQSQNGIDRALNDGLNDFKKGISTTIGSINTLAQEAEEHFFER